MQMCSSCCVASCVVTVTVHGCAGLGLAGATVEIRQAGVLKDSGTTNSSGQVVLTVPRASISALTVTKTRFNGSGTVGVTTTGATAVSTINLTAATGYSCFGVACTAFIPARTCADPVPTSLVLTLNTGTVTLTGTGGNWQGTEDRGGIRFKYTTAGCQLNYVYCALGNAGDPTCANTASYTGPTTYTDNPPPTCPTSYLMSGTLTSPHNSGSWSITE
jgi:hypothetical protein